MAQVSVITAVRYEPPKNNQKTSYQLKKCKFSLKLSYTETSAFQAVDSVLITINILRRTYGTVQTPWQKEYTVFNLQMT